MYQWDKGLKLPDAGLSVDITRRQERGFISHAHGDHVGRHETIFCTPETESLCRVRMKLKPTQRFIRMPYYQGIECGDLRLTTYPAGHCLGSAMLLAEHLRTGKRLLYTGDFKLGPSSTSVEAVIPKTDYLVMESTYGTPEYRLPPREETIARLVEEIGNTFDMGMVPVVYAYGLGKSQEVTRILTDTGFKVQQGKSIHDISLVYENHGVPLGDVTRLDDANIDPDRVLIVPPRGCSFKTRRKVRTFMVSGWAHTRGATYRFGVDVALPLSDHADFDDLVRTVELAEPELVLCTHGGPEFVDHLNDLGFHARPLDGPYQGRLF